MSEAEKFERPESKWKRVKAELLPEWAETTTSLPKLTGSTEGTRSSVDETGKKEGERKSEISATELLHLEGFE